MTVIVVSLIELVLREHSKDHAVAVVYFNDTLTAGPYATLLDSTQVPTYSQRWIVGLTIGVLITGAAAAQQSPVAPVKTCGGRAPPLSLRPRSIRLTMCNCEDAWRPFGEGTQEHRSPAARHPQKG